MKSAATRRSWVRAVTRASSEWEGWLDLGFAATQLSVWWHPFPEAGRLMGQSVLHPAELLSAAALRLSGLAFWACGSLALALPLAAVVAVRRRPKRTAVARLLAGWAGAATLLEVAGASGSNLAGGGVVGRVAVDLLDRTVPDPVGSALLAAVVGGAAVLWAAGAMKPLGRLAVGCFDRLVSALDTVAVAVWETVRAATARPAAAVPTPSPSPPRGRMRTSPQPAPEPGSRRPAGDACAVDEDDDGVEIIEAEELLEDLDATVVEEPDAPDASTARRRPVAAPRPPASEEVQPGPPLSPADADARLDELLRGRRDLNGALRAAAVRKARRRLALLDGPPDKAAVRRIADEAAGAVVALETAWRRELARTRNPVGEVEDLVYRAAPVDFDFVAGMDELKQSLDTVIRGVLEHADMVERVTGERPTGTGMLLYGAPGCGKTFLATATAGEFAARFGMRVIHAGLESIKGLHWSQQVARIGDIFDLAGRISPCVVIWDEFDAYASDAQRTRRKYDAEKAAVFKQRLEGSVRQDGLVVHVATTNWPWQIELPLLRPGRLGILHHVPPPDAAARQELVAMRLGRMQVDEPVDPAELAEWAEGNTPAEIIGFLDAAAQRAVADNLAHPGGPVRGLLRADLEAARERLERRSSAAWVKQARRELGRAENEGMREMLGVGR